MSQERHDLIMRLVFNSIDTAVGEEREYSHATEHWINLISGEIRDILGMEPEALTGPGDS